MAGSFKLRKKRSCEQERRGYDRAYRHFLLWQCSELAKGIKVLFDPGNLVDAATGVELKKLAAWRFSLLSEVQDALNRPKR